MTTYVYYASMQEYGVEYFVGVFSTTAKAQSACEEWARIHSGARVLKWVGSADVLTAVTFAERYEINPLELDLMILPAESGSIK